MSFRNLVKFREFVHGYGPLLMGSGLLALFGCMAIAGVILETQEPSVRGLPFQSPSLQHPLGTDDVGQDLFRLLLRATPASLLVGLLAGGISVFLGTAIGLMAGYARPVWSETLSGLIDVVLLIPMVPFMVFLTAYLGPGLGNIILAIACLGWGGSARAVRAKTLQLRESLFIESLVALGFASGRIVFRHVLPNVWDVVSARFVIAVAGALLSEAALSFMGLGDPLKPSWGKIMHFAFHRGGFANGLWYWYVPPGLCITFSALGFIFIGMWLEVTRTEATLEPERSP